MVKRVTVCPRNGSERGAAFSERFCKVVHVIDEFAGTGCVDNSHRLANFQELKVVGQHLFRIGLPVCVFQFLSLDQQVQFHAEIVTLHLHWHALHHSVVLSLILFQLNS